MKLNITSGEYQPSSNQNWTDKKKQYLQQISINGMTGKIEIWGREEAFDTALLFCDAANTYQRCEMLPSQLLNELSNVSGILIEARGCISSLKRSILVHPDCTEGSEFDDYSSYAQEVEDKIESLIQKLQGDDQSK